MGKSDDLIFPEYSKILSGLPRPKSVAFLGSKEDSRFTSTITADTRHFYDLQLGNWNINSDWKLTQKYDLIVCTRCAYFSKNPDLFIEKCKNYLTFEGHALVDWGLGDHWRFPKYKVGWLRDGEHEFAYDKKNYLHSCYWSDDLEFHPEVVNFWNQVKSNSFGYSSNIQTLSSVVRQEIPALVVYKCKKTAIKWLWKDRPQLYILTLFGHNEL